MSLPCLRLRKGKQAAVAQGMPWIFAGDIIDSSALALLEPGALVEVRDVRDVFLGMGYYNAAAALACRVLSLRCEPINTAFFEYRFRNALARRHYDGPPYMRVVHAEADGVPGLVVDRFGDVLSVQIGTAGIEQLRTPVTEALMRVFTPRAIVLRSDAPAHERVPRDVRVIGDLPHMPLPVHQNGVTYFADLLQGQKTGWYFDQRDNHALFAGHCAGKTVLDVYAHSGGFGLLAAAKGATHVTLVDRSDAALALARQAGGTGLRILTADAFDAMAKLIASGERFGCVSIDPPPFVKTKHDVVSGMKGYEKAAYLGTQLVEPQGVLMIASCSHHAQPARFGAAVAAGVARAGRTAQVLARTGASWDHPVHPHLPQTAYLKSILLRID